MEGKRIKEFPDVDNKLQAPTKKSLFEKQKAEQEAKRLREEAETAAVYQDFIKSFDDEEEDANLAARGGFGGGNGGGFGQGGYGAPTGPPRRVFSSALPSGPGRGGFPSAQGRAMGSGPGSLGPPPQSMRSGPGSLGPPPQSRGFSRGLAGFDQPTPPRGPPSAFHQPPPTRAPAAFQRYEQPPPPSRGRDHNDRRAFAFEDDQEPRREAAPRSKMPAAFAASDDEDDVAHAAPRRPAEPPIPKPTIQMSNLPPGTSPAAIKALLPSSLTVDAVRIIPPSGPASATERKSMSAIVTLSKETAASDIDVCVSQLRDHYLGYGFYLSLSRHLSTAALSSAPIPSLTSGQAATQPFGAKQALLDQPTQTAHMHAPPGSYRGIAPPTSYTSAPSAPSGPVFHVPVSPPSDIRELRLIHKTLEKLLTHGPEFEALLMSRPDVQKEEKWAWIWDARSVGGIWYRWRLWELLTGAENKPGRYLPVFEDMPAWKAPEARLPFEYVTRLEEVVESEEYVSSGEEDSEEEGRGRDRRGMEKGGREEGETFLNPMLKAHLTHLLARLPGNVQKLRRGDVARVTAFALRNAKRGAPEVVEMVVQNVLRPYSATSANPEHTPTHSGDEEDGVEDTSAASLVGLRLIPDIIAAALNSGVSSARVYRQLFEKTIEQRQVFGTLGALERRMKWGRMSTEKWRASVRGELGRWKDGCLFMPGAPEAWLQTFAEPRVQKVVEAEGKGEEREKGKSGRWKAVREGEAKGEVGMQDVATAASIEEDEEDVDGVPMEEDVDGEPMATDDEDVDGEPMEEDDEDVDGVPMSMDEDGDETSPAPLSADTEMQERGGGEPEDGKAARKRPRAEDMFADSGSEGEVR